MKMEMGSSTHAWKPPPGRHKGGSGCLAGLFALPFALFALLVALGAPKQRKSGGFGGSGHQGSKMSSIRRGGSPSLGRAGSGKTPNKGGGCVLFLFTFLALGIAVTYFVNTLSA